MRQLIIKTSFKKENMRISERVIFAVGKWNYILNRFHNK
jgi:hypothetical protein